MTKKRTSHRDTSTRKEQKSVSALIDKKKEKKITYLEDWYNFTTHERDFLTTGTAERIARELVAWARGNEEALKVSQFLELRGINRRTWNRWCIKYEIIADAYDFALMVLGNRREIGVMTRKFDSGATSFMMVHYDEDWREALALRSKLNSSEGLSSGQKFVVIEKYPDSPLVPVRVREDGIPEREDKE